MKQLNKNVIDKYTNNLLNCMIHDYYIINVQFINHNHNIYIYNYINLYAHQ